MMNKYERAIDILISYCFYLHRSRDNGVHEAINSFKELVENHEKYKWHSPDDLPKEECVRVLCKLLHFGDHEINYSIVKYKNKKWDTGYFYDVLAWRYIEPFEESEE